MQDALEALKKLFSDPIGSIGEIFQRTDSSRIVGMSLVFAGIYALSFAWTFRSLLQTTEHYMSRSGGLFGALAYQYGAQQAGLDWSKILLATLIPPISLFAAVSAVGAMLRGGLKAHACGYVATVTLLPQAVWLLAISFIGVGNVEVILLLLFFCLCYMAIMLYTGYTRVLELAESRSAFAVPLSLLAMLWMTKVIVFALFVH